MVSLTQESTDSGAEQKKRSRPGMVVAEAMKIKEKQIDHTGPHKSRWRRLTRFEVNSATNIVQQKHVQKPRGGKTPRGPTQVQPPVQNGRDHRNSQLWQLCVLVET